jgi:hypothetical protein
MAKMNALEEALRNSSGKSTAEALVAKPTPREREEPRSRGAKTASREGKEHIGAWLNPDFNTSLRMIQLHRGRDAQGNRVYLADLMAEALNDLFLKYDVPTVQRK